jgi:glycosyltransferase involved in cell wall biosynthesis
MKVLVVNNMAPFIWGGAEELAQNLCDNLIVAGHESEVLRIPFQWEPSDTIVSQMLMVRSFELCNVDRVIALKFPAYLIRHPQKTIWLLHQYRQAYDLYDTGHTNLPMGDSGQRLKTLIRNADNESFEESLKIFTNSNITKQRLKKYNGFDGEVLLPPVNNPTLFCGGASKGYIFAGGRINNMKRQYLLVEALAKTNKNVKLIVAGPPDTPNDAQTLENLVEKFGLRDRIKLDLRFLPRQTYAQYINHSMAVAYLPFDEDSLGYVAMEAATASKPIITTTDSGGILDLVKHQQTGWIAEPSVQSLAQTMSLVQPSIAISYGEETRKLWQSLGVNWQTIIKKLLT